MSKFRFVTVAAIAGTILFVVGITTSLAQNTQTTDHKADQNLKSSSRVNPSTLAMEFSIPLASYPGRKGNSLPVVLNYSSKVWTMEQLRFRTQATPGTGDIIVVRQTTDIHAIFGKRTIAGWTSTLQPPVMIQETEFYDQYGNLMRTGEGIATTNFTSLSNGQNIISSLAMIYKAHPGATPVGHTASWRRVRTLRSRFRLR